MSLEAAAGDYSDFQKASEILHEEMHQARVNGHGDKADPEEIAQFMANKCYAARSKSDPLYFEGIVAGVLKGHQTLTLVDLYGNKYSDNAACVMIEAGSHVELIGNTMEGCGNRINSDSLTRGQTREHFEDVAEAAPDRPIPTNSNAVAQFFFIP